MYSFKGPDGQEDMPYLLTPGPVTTPRSIKLALLADFSNDDAEFHAAILAIRRELIKLVAADDTYDCVLLPWPRTHALECVLGSLCTARRKKTLVVSNGADAEQVSMLLQQLKKLAVPLTYRETSRAKAADVAKTLQGDKSIAHVWVMHCESSTGLINPAAEIAREVKAAGRICIVDASMSLGAVPISLRDEPIDVLLSSSESALESLPGISIVIAKRSILEAAMGQSHSPALDLHARWQTMDQPQHSDLPTHATLALREALRELELEGGVANRAERYKRVAHVVRERLQALGLSMLINDQAASHLLQCVLAPKHGAFRFQRFSEHLYARGFVVARGTLTKHKTFRVGCMGQINESVIMHLAIALEEVLKEMDVRIFAAPQPS